MAEVLSQGEIDSLLNGLKSGNLDAEMTETGKVCQAYDFRRPSKFSKDSLRTLHLLHETFARHFTSTLSGYLRTETRCSLILMEQVTYEEFLRSLPSPTLLCISTLEPGEKVAIVEMSLSIVFGVLDRLLGGPGSGEVPNRELTEIEESLSEDVVHRFLADLSTVWSTITQVDFRMKKIESQPQFAQVISPGEIVLAVCLEVTIGSYDGFVNICLPFSSMEGIMAAFSTEKWLSASAPEGEQGNEDELRIQLEDALIPVIVELGTVSLTLSELGNLEEGQVIRLEKGVEDTVLVRMGNRPAFLASPGTSGKKMAVQVQRLAQNIT